MGRSNRHISDINVFITRSALFITVAADVVQVFIQKGVIIGGMAGIGERWYPTRIRISLHVMGISATPFPECRFAGFELRLL